MLLKRVLDLTISVSLLCLLSPILLLIALLVKLGSDGPVFFVQDRLGRDGVIFRMYKFRTMVVNAEHTGTGLCSFHDDPRVTRVGKYLRKVSLDELPQLFNVVLGAMSIVGPRPPVTYELGEFTTLSDEMKVRFRVKPGITGLAQVSGRNALGWEQKIVFDNQYVALFERWGVAVDVVIILKTAWVIMSTKDVVEQPPVQDV
jgi:lipopolysaccharide/colanic/teichoic acid biosynthesis glycosyltransferase